jgi:hypothetical protein
VIDGRFRLVSVTGRDLLILSGGPERLKTIAAWLYRELERERTWWLPFKRM